MKIENDIKLSYLSKLRQNIAIIEPDSSVKPQEWYSENQQLIEELLLKSGGVLLRNFDIHSTYEFNRFANRFCSNLLDYTYRSSPRTRVGGKIYTSTEYPSDRHIPLHNENSYTKNWPRHILFYCSIAPTLSGGQTPLADSRLVYQRLDNDIIEKFEKYGVLYVRNYTSGIDLSWKEVFQTDKKEDVEIYCNANNISCEWGDNEVELTTKQIAQASLIHPITKEKVWFNQAHLFHISSLPTTQQDLIKDVLGEDFIPRNTYYGDGSEIEPEILDAIRNTYKQNQLEFDWRIGDILILDNVLVAHGRNPYQGERKILVAMGD